MIAALLTQIETSIGTDIGSRKYAVVVPVNATFPCVLVRRTFTDQYQTKDGANRAMTRVQCSVQVKDSVGAESAYQIAYNLANTLKTDLNALLVSGTEYRVNDMVDYYEEETELFYTTLDIEIQHNF